MIVAAMRLTVENVLRLEHQALQELCLPDVPDEMAVRMLGYIDGVHEMAELVKQMIVDLGGN